MFFAFSKSKSESIDSLKEIILGEMNYLFNNLNDRLLFIIEDLLDIYKDNVPENQEVHSIKTLHLITANPLLQTINYISEDRRIIFSSLYDTNKEVIGLKIELSAPKEALEQAEELNEYYLSMPFEIIQGDPGYSLMIPSSVAGFNELVFKKKVIIHHKNKKLAFMQEAQEKRALFI